MGKPEADYYKLSSKPIGTPPTGQILLQKMAHSRILKVTTANEESHRFLHGPDTNAMLVSKFGVPKDKVDGIVDYVWSFNQVLIKVNPVTVAATTAVNHMPLV